MTRAGREVALLGGSFNPPHVAHMMAAYWTLATQEVSEVWLLPAYRHPFGKALAPFEDRVKMCELAATAARGGARARFEDRVKRGERAAAAVRGVEVCTAEAELAGDPLVGKTARTLE